MAISFDLDLIAAPHTPFDAQGALRMSTIDVQAERLIESGVRGGFIGGSTGEFSSLSCEERQLLFERWAQVARGRLFLFAHVGGDGLEDGRKLARAAANHRMDAIAALPPHYFGVDEVESLAECCAAWAGAAPDLPFFYYHIPALTGVDPPMAALLSALTQRIPSFSGVKYTSADLVGFQTCVQFDGGRLCVLYGQDESLLAGLSLGAQAAVGSSYNFAAPLYRRLITAFRTGDMMRAREEQSRSVRLIETLASFGYFGASKALMAMLDVDCGPPRLPLPYLPKERWQALRSRLESIGFFEWGLATS